MRRKQDIPICPWDRSNCPVMNQEAIEVTCNTWQATKQALASQKNQPLITHLVRAWRNEVGNQEHKKFQKIFKHMETTKYATE